MMPLISPPVNAPVDSVKALIGECLQSIGRFEALIILGHVLQKTREWLIAHDDYIVTGDDKELFKALVALRQSGVPIAYITGRQEFYGRYFHVDKNVLIPRPDTEVLVEQALGIATEHPRILDLGTGSGCIAITLKLEIPNASVLATDASLEAIDVARLNAKELNADIEFKTGLWWNAFDKPERFDIIVSNPPYIRPDDPHLGALSFEPLTALTDGVDGLQCYRDIIEGALQFLEHNGWLILEHGYDQAHAVRSMLEEAGFAAVHTRSDYGGNDRVTLGRRV